MSIIRKIPVILSPDEAEQVFECLRISSTQSWDTSRRIKKPTTREFYESRGRQASDLAAIICSRLYSTE